MKLNDIPAVVIPSDATSNQLIRITDEVIYEASCRRRPISVLVVQDRHMYACLAGRHPAEDDSLIGVYNGAYVLIENHKTETDLDKMKNTGERFEARRLIWAKVTMQQSMHQLKDAIEKGQDEAIISMSNGITHIDLNQHFRFKPSDDGKRWYAMYHYEHAIRMAKPEWMVMSIDADGYTRMQMHEFMKIFGPHISMTANWPCVGKLELTG